MICPICTEEYPSLVHHFHGPHDEALKEQLKKEKQDWSPVQGACTRCVDQAQLDQWESTQGEGQTFEAQKAEEYWILPIPTRLMAHPKYTGKGVTMCFIDSGFYPHPDLTLPENRILKALDINQPEKDLTEVWEQPNPYSWHGTMTTAVSAGNGYTSNGIYRGLASNAKLVLLKVMDETGTITGDSIAKALKWVEENHETYNIRIINLSVTDDWAISYQESEIGLAIERLLKLGIHVVAAAGNDSHSLVKMPANSPHAITVGGLDDANTLNPLTHSLYHSAFGPTVDKTHKPEIIAPAIWLPAPILPGTKEHKEAQALFTIKNTSDAFRKNVAANLLHQTQINRAILTKPLEALDKAIEERLEQAKFITPHFQHSDGTSFAAPIVCSIIAQMLEANSKLTPTDVRDLLLRTARKLPGFPEQRQGFGVVHALSAVHHAEEDHHEYPPYFSPVIDYKNKSVSFHHHQEEAQEVEVSGSFNNREEPVIKLEEKEEHYWEAASQVFAPGKYTYKYLIDHDTWETDTRNLFREPDGLGGFNSLLIIEQ